MLFYIFYVLLVSIVFSFIFPTILVMLWKNVLDPTNPIFENIQIAIFILIFVFTLTFRKFFYLPVFSTIETTVSDIKIDNKNEEIQLNKVSTDNTVKSFSQFDDLNNETVNVIESDINKTERFNPDFIYNNDNIINKNHDIEIVDSIPNLDIKIGKEIK